MKNQDGAAYPTFAWSLDGTPLQEVVARKRSELHFGENIHALQINQVRHSSVLFGR